MVTYQSPDTKWANRHAALIGIKYWMAVRQDLLDSVLVGGRTTSFSPIVDGDSETPIFSAITEGLKDRNDDVRAVASSSLLPITGLLVQVLPPIQIFNSIVLILWDCLTELDDLTSATASVMDLLADLIR